VLVAAQWIFYRIIVRLRDAPTRDGAGGIPCGCSESHSSGANHLRDPWKHRRLGLHRCGPNVGISPGQFIGDRYVPSTRLLPVRGFWVVRRLVHGPNLVGQSTHSVSPSRGEGCAGTIYIECGLDINIIYIYIISKSYIGCLPTSLPTRRWTTPRSSCPPPYNGVRVVD
jgi:hypothetical protein